jgi:type II secretory pathway predicted ATPase ExeA
MIDSIKKWGWKANPFTLRIDPALFTGYEEQVRAALRHIENKHKIALVTGATGSGKTSLLKWLEANIDNAARLYVSKPPAKAEDFIKIFTGIFGLSFWERLLGRMPTLYNLPKYVSAKLKGTHLIFLLDEGHETSRDVLEWLRVLVDQIDGISLIIAGLPALEGNIKSNLETFDQRITTRISLTALSESETRALIQKRIEATGGSGILPFTDSAIQAIYSLTGGFPREVLKLCDKLIMDALEDGRELIEATALEAYREFKKAPVLEEPAVAFAPKPPSEAQLANLPRKQKSILELLAKTDWLTPAAIAEQIGGRYASRGHAVRSINNILHRLMLDGYVQREARGKAYMYALTPKLRTLFVER